MRTTLALLSLCSGLAVAPAAFAQASPSPDPDYADPATWLCLPGREDACAVDLTATAVAADGSLSVERFEPAKDPAFDCFYVYPTVSTDPTPNADMTVDPAERSVIANQFARFGAVCRTFAPLYRQVTLATLRAAATGNMAFASKADRVMTYRDVKAAWEHYLKVHNDGRDVLLVGHSQGSGVLKALVANDIEGKPVSERVIAAYLTGANMLVPEGKTVGGDFKVMPACTSATQTGCIVSYVSFRSTTVPPANSRFGRTAQPGMEVMCTNPADLTGKAPAPLDAYLGNGSSIVDSAAAPARVWATGAKVETPWVKLPGLMSAQCVRKAGASYLDVAISGNPADPRTDDIPGDVVVNGNVQADWGLHLVDVNILMGDLVKLAATQAAAKRAARAAD